MPVRPLEKLLPTFTNPIARIGATRAKSNPLEGWVSQSRGQSECDNGEFSEASGDRLQQRSRRSGAPTPSLEVLFQILARKPGLLLRVNTSSRWSWRVRMSSLASPKLRSATVAERPRMLAGALGP